MKIFDLTMEIDERTPVFLGDRKQEITQHATIAKEGWNEKKLSFTSHFSTHIDAPSHMLEGAKNLDDFPISFFIGEGIVLDSFGKNPIEVDLGLVKEGDIVFFYTGHSENLYSDSYFQDNPVITRKTADELIQRKARIIGLDSFTPDNEPYALHKLLFKYDILVVENLVNLKPLVGKRFECIILPLKIKHADGAPCRVIARFSD